MVLAPKNTFPPAERTVLGGPWDLVTTYNWAYNPTYSPPKWAYRGLPQSQVGL